MQYEIEEQIPVAVTPADGEVIEVTRRKAFKEPLPPYNIVGNGFRNKNGASVDILEVCLQLNRAETKLLQFFRDQFTKRIMRRKEQPNIVEPASHEEFSKYLATALKKNYSHLEYLQVIRRIKRGLYILNPLIYVPPRGYSEMMVVWHSAVPVEEEV